MDRTFIQALKARGFSLAEILIALGITVTVAAIVIPSATKFRHQLQLRQATDALMSGLNRARSEAVTRGIPVVMCPAQAGYAVCGERYRDGWLLFTDTDGDAVYDPAAERLLASAPALPAGFQVSDRLGKRDAGETIRYWPDGSARRSQSQVYCAPPESSLAPWTVVLSHVGRARLARGEGRCPA